MGTYLGKHPLGVVVPMAYRYLEKKEAEGIYSVSVDDSIKAPIFDLKIGGNSAQVLLPSEYQQVEYLENSGTQRIDVGLVPTNSTSIDITYQSLIVSATSQYIAGSREHERAVIEYALNGSSFNSFWDIRFNGVAKAMGTRTTDKYRSTIELNNGSGSWTLTNLTTNETNETTLSGAVVNATVSLFLFAYNNLDANTHTNLRIFACKVYESNVLVRNYVPCYRKADNEKGFYDLVTNEFYTNAGTGEFSVGADVENTPTPEQPIQVQSVGDKTKNLFNESNIIKGYFTSDVNTITSSNNYRVVKIDNLKAGTYTISLGTPFYLIRQWIDGEQKLVSGIVATKLTFTATTNGVYALCFRKSDNTAITEDFTVQVEQGTMATDYEPYGYRIPVNIYTDNLVNENTVLENKLISSANIGNIVDSEIYNTLYMEVEEGRTYVFKNFVRADGTTLRGCFYDSNGAWVSAIEDTTVTIPSGVKYVGRSFNKEVKDVQLYLIHTTTNIYLKEPLRKINDVLDILDYKNKKVTRNIGNYIFIGEENFYNAGSGFPYACVIGNYITNYVKGNNIPLLSNSYTNVINTEIDKTNGTGKFCQYGSAWYFNHDNQTIGANNFKNFLKTKYQEGDPVKVYYQLETPTEENIDVPIINTLEGTTNLKIETEIEPSYVKLIYGIDAY